MTDRPAEPSASHEEGVGVRAAGSKAAAGPSAGTAAQAGAETATANEIATANWKDTLATVFKVMLPTLAKGPIIRRWPMVALAERLDLDGRAVRHCQEMRRRYGAGPLMLALPGRPQALILSAADLDRVLSGAPAPFTPASWEKQAALAHFEPRNALISRGPERAKRRDFNEDALDTGRPLHRMSDQILPVVREEAEGLAATTETGAVVDWQRFVVVWTRMVRRVVLGNDAGDDDELTDMLARLRSDANWAFLKPKRTALRARFHERLNAHLARAQPGSLAARIATLPKDDETAPSDQVAQWFFAFEPGGMAAMRALALLAAHPDSLREVQRELRTASCADRPHLPYLRACFMESLRLWPTTPAILRETTEDVRWGNSVVPKGTGILIFAPFFHRDDQTLEHAHRFAPELWREGMPRPCSQFVPFSGGPAICPAHHFVPMIASTFLAALLKGRSLRFAGSAALDPARPLPATLDNSSLRFELSEAAAPGA